jgi:hypothetical protein
VHFGAEGAVVVVVDFGMFEELPGVHIGLELFRGEEVVVPPVDLALAWGSGGAGDGVVGGSGLGEAAAEGGFSGPGGA